MYSSTAVAAFPRCIPSFLLCLGWAVSPVNFREGALCANHNHQALWLSHVALEGLMLRLRLQYFGHLMWRTDSFEKTLIQSGRSPGEENGYRLRYSCLENSMNRGACRLQSMGSQSRTWLSNWTVGSGTHFLSQRTLSPWPSGDGRRPRGSLQPFSDALVPFLSCDWDLLMLHWVLVCNRGREPSLAQSFLDDCMKLALLSGVESHKARRPVPGPPSWLMVIMQWCSLEGKPLDWNTHFPLVLGSVEGFSWARSGTQDKCLLFQSSVQDVGI